MLSWIWKSFLWDPFFIPYEDFGLGGLVVIKGLIYNKSRRIDPSRKVDQDE
jgi:hypothetical protein